MTWLVTVHHDVLPAVMRDVIETNPVWNYVVAPGMLLLCVIAIALLWARRRSLLDLWLLAVAWAWLLDAILLNLVDYRFTVAWYANRVFAISSATFVLAVLLSETTMMYARLALSVMAQRRERESRIMTVDAVAASIAHEINQPLAAIVNNGGAGLRWLARGAPDVDKASEALKAIVNDGHRASQVIAGIRATFKRDRPEKERLDINGVINEALVLTRSDLQDHGIVVDTELDAKLPAISANKVQLQQVLLNLIANASEAMDAVTSRARLLRIRTQRHGENEVLVAVEDAGPGIDPQDGGRMFDAFVTTKSGGMGLGLPICRSIIDAHGGRLWATPGIAYGSAFQFVLPARDPGEA